MKKISVINLKGGVGKTTTVLNLGKGLALKDKRVLLIDLDPQANLSISLFTHSEKTIYDVLINNTHPIDVIINISENLDMICANDSLGKAEMIMAGMPARESILKRALEPIFNYDYVIIDCPPSESLLNYNALFYSTEAIIPVSTDYLGIVGLKKVVGLLDTINSLFGHEVKISAVLPTLYDKRNKICKESYDEIKKGFNGEVVNPIRINSKLKEAPKFGMSIFEYDKHSNGSKDYSQVIDQLLSRQYFY